MTTWNNVIWTDESSVQLKRHYQTVKVKIGRERSFKPAAKHALNVHVWGEISKRRATHNCIFGKTMDATLYIQTLEDYLLPFTESHFQGTDYHFMQNNNPKHTSLKARAFYEDKGINWWPIPASSADFNPIECVWRELKYYYIASEIKPMTKKEVVDGIMSFSGQAMTAAKCRQYIEYTHPCCTAEDH